MRCRCGNEISVEISSRITPKGCSVLSSVVSVAVIKCKKCGHITQVSMSGASPGKKEDLYVN